MQVGCWGRVRALRREVYYSLPPHIFSYVPYHYAGRIEVTVTSSMGGSLRSASTHFLLCTLSPCRWDSQQGQVSEGKLIFNVMIFPRICGNDSAIKMALSC